MARRFPRINQTVLTAFLLVSVPGLVGAVLIALLLGQSRMREFYGQHLAFIAEQTAAVVDAYVYRKILDVSVLGRTPDLRVAAAAGTRQPLDEAMVQSLDEQWRSAAQVPPPLSGLFEAPASRFLADVVVHDRVYRELLLTDRQGRLVAASNRVTDYNQADEDWWKAAIGDDGRGRVSVTDVRWDDSARTLALEVAVPVNAPGGDELSGVLKAVIDARELLASVAGLRPGDTGQATLVRANGSMVFNRSTSDSDTRYFATEELTRALDGTESGPASPRFALSANAPDGSPQVVGVAPSQLSRSYPNVAWYVAISQAEREFMAPVRTVGSALAVFAGAAVLLVLVVAFYFSMRLAAPDVDLDMGLVQHPRIERMPDTGDEPDVATGTDPVKRP
jgi:Cache domain